MTNLQKQQIIEVLHSFVQSLKSVAISLQKTINLSSQVIKASSASQISKIVLIKIQMFITNCQAQVKKIEESHKIQKYFQNLTFLKERYNQLIKQAYRAANFESLQSQIQKQDVKKIGNQRKNKIQCIKNFQREMEQNWESTFCVNEQNLNRSKLNNNRSSIMFDLYDQKQKRMKKVQMLGDISQISLEELAKSELQKQLLSMRIIALNMYQKYKNHSHESKLQKICFLKAQQESLSNQINQITQINQQMKRSMKRLLKEYEQVKIINKLMNKRYRVKKSIQTQQSK